MLLSLGRTTNKPSTRIIAHPVGSTTIYGVIVVPVAGAWELQFEAGSIVDTYVSALDIGGNQIFGHVVLPIEIVPDYVPPEIVNLSAGGATVDNLVMAMLDDSQGNGNFNMQGWQLDLDSGFVYVYQFNSLLSDISYLTLTDDQNSGSTGVEYIRFRTDSGQLLTRLNSTNNIDNAIGCTEGTLIIDTVNTTYEIRDSSDVLVNIVDWSQYGSFVNRSLYVGFSIATPLTGESLEVICDKTLFPYPTSTTGLNLGESE